jgi:hypothetical protein
LVLCQYRRNRQYQNQPHPEKNLPHASS